MNYEQHFAELKSRHVKYAKPRPLSGEDILRQRAIKKQEDKIETKQENTMTFRDISNRHKNKKKTKEQEKKEIKFSYENKIKSRNELTFSKVIYETPIFINKKPLIKVQENIKTYKECFQEIRNRHNGTSKRFVPTPRDVPNHDPSYHFKYKGWI